MNWSMICSFSVILFVVNGFVLADGEVFAVGDEGGWNMQVNYGSWSDGHNFTVGDVLGFKYTKSEHNVYEVSREVFQSCNTSNGDVIAKYQTGNDQIKLKQAKKYWFICQVDGHCLGGMRLAIEVKPQAGGSGVDSSASAGTGAAAGSSSSSGDRNGYTFGRWFSSFVYLAFVIACIWK